MPKLFEQVTGRKENFLSILKIINALGWFIRKPSLQLVVQSCPTLCHPMGCSTSGLPVHHQLQQFTQTHVHWVSDDIQPSHPLLSLSPPAFNLSQNQGIFKWVSSSHHVAKVLVSASTSVLPMNIQDWSPLGWTGWTSLHSKGLSRVFSNTTVQKHQYLVLSFLYNPTLTSIYDYWKNHSFLWLDSLCWQSNISAF